MVCFVILHYIAFDETAACVHSILRNIEGEKQVIIIDNASPNNTGNALNEYYRGNKRITVLMAERNLGFAQGNNIGYKYAVKYFDPDFIVVMNNDMVIKQHDFIAEIYKSYDEYGYYIMGPDVFSTKKEIHQNPEQRQIPSQNELRSKYRKLWLKDKFKFLFVIKWVIYTILFKFKPEKHEKIDDNYVDHVVINPLLHGSCYIFSKLFTEKNPETCFYGKTFMYMEAEILHYLAKKNGFKMIYYPFIKVFHHEDVSTDQEYKRKYKKAIFTVRCLLQSCKVFLELMEQDV